MSDLENVLRSYFKNGGTQKSVNHLIGCILYEQPKFKVVINECYGGFSLSSFACKSLDINPDDEGCNIARTDSRLISLIENCGSEKISGYCAQLQIYEVPLGSAWTIHDCDGNETLSW